MKRNVILKKSLALLLSVLVAVSAFASLSLLTSAAASADDLSATFDFENGDASAWVQVGGKTGNETTEGYNTWNYDPTVGDFTGLNKATIEQAQIDIANGTNISSVTSKALLVGGYLNIADDYTGANAASSATAVENPAELTSLVALAQTVDSGVAKSGLKKKSVSGKVSLNYAETDPAGTNIAMNNVGNTNSNKLAFRSTPVIAYYFKDKDNWRGIRLTQAYWNGVAVFDYLAWQLIVCENGYCYRSAFTTFSNYGNSAKFAGTMADPAYFNEFTVSKNFTSIGGAATTKGTTGDGFYPVIAGIRNATVKSTLKATEWLNFNVKYEDGLVGITIADATGFAHNVYIPNNAAYTLYNDKAETATASIIDPSEGTFALGSSYSIGTNALGTTVQSKNAFDDIKVNMTDSSEKAVDDVIKAINAVNDKDSFASAKQAYEALTESQKARVNNAQVYKVLASKYDDKHFVADFSEDWQADLIKYAYSNQIASNKGSVAPNSDWRYYSYINSLVKTSATTNALKIRCANQGNSFGGGFYLNINNDTLTDLESATISTRNGLVISSNSDFNTFAGIANSSNNGTPAIIVLDDNNEAYTRDVHQRLFYSEGYWYLSSAWAGNKSYKINVDLMQKFDVVLKPVSATKTAIQFVGYKLEDDGNGEIKATNTYGPTTDAEGKETSYTLNAALNKVALSFGVYCYTEIESIDVKYVGWEKCVKLTPEEEALRDRIAAIGEITVTNYATKSATVAAIRSDYDKLNSANLADAIPEGFTDPCKTILANAEAAIANYTGYVNDAQDFVDTYETAINYTVPDITNTTIAQAVVDAKLAYDTLSDGVKSVLNNNYSLVGYSFAVGTTLVDTLYPVAIALIPTQNQIDFETYYNDNSLAAATSATVDLAKLDTALTKYYAIEEEHKVAVVTQYNHMIEMLDGLFVVDGGKQFTYDAAKYAQYTNIYNYFKDTMLKVTENGNTNNDKVVNSAKYDATQATTMTLAYDYGTLNASKSDYISYDLFNIFPKINKIDSLKNNTPSNYLFRLEKRSNKPTVYVNGENAQEGTNKAIAPIPYYNNSYSGDADYNNAQFYARARAGSALSTGEVDGSYSKDTSKYINTLVAHPDANASLASCYQANFDRLCIMMEYETVYDPQFTSPYDSGTYKRTGIRISELLFWYEDSSKDGTEGNTPYVLDATKDKTWTLDNGTSDFLIRYSTLTTEIGITYTESEVILPQLYIGDTAISHLQYVKLTREATLAEKYEQVLAKAAAGTITDADINDVLALYNDYNNLSATNKALLGTQALENCEKAFKFIRPNNNGATISLGQTTSLGFACKRPTSSKYYKFGVVIASYNAMVDNNVTVLEKDAKGSQFYEKLYTDLDVKGDELIFNIFGLFGDNSTEHWGKWIVARFYSVYKDSNGNDVVVYNSEAFVDGDGNNNNPTDATEIDTSNVIVRSINGVIKGAASKLYSYKDNTTLNVMTGASYVDATGATLTDYNSTTLATALASTTNGMLGTATDTLYLLKAYKDVFTATLAG